MAVIFLLEIVLFIGISLILDLMALEYRDVVYSTIGLVAPLWELGQFFLAGLSNVVVTVGFSGTAFTNDTIGGSSIMALLALIVVLGSYITIAISLASRKNK